MRPLPLVLILAAGCGGSEPAPKEYPYVFRVYWPKSEGASMMTGANVAEIEIDGVRYKTGVPVTLPATTQVSDAARTFKAVHAFATCGALTSPLKLDFIREDYERGKFRESSRKDPIPVNLVVDGSFPATSQHELVVDNRAGKKPARVTIGKDELAVPAREKLSKTLTIEPCPQAQAIKLDDKEIGRANETTLIDTSGRACYLQLTASYTDAPSTVAKLDPAVVHSLGGVDLFRYPPLVIQGDLREIRSLHDCADLANLKKYNITEILRRSR